MSNLFKQYNTVEREKDVRVIDYNPMVEEKLAELVRQQNGGGPDADGFQALGFVVPEIIEEDPQEAIERQKREAEEILNSARREAEERIASAQSQAVEIQNEARESGCKQGYEEGYAKVKAELEEEYGQKQNELERLKCELMEDYNKQLRELEPKLLDTILTVVENVFHIQFDDKREILLYLVRNAIANIDGCRSFCIRTGKAEKEFLDSHREEILSDIGHEISLEIAADVSLEEGKCIIETDTGIFDCGTGVQLKNLIKDLKSLCL